MNTETEEELLDGLIKSYQLTVKGARVGNPSANDTLKVLRAAATALAERLKVRPNPTILEKLREELPDFAPIFEKNWLNNPCQNRTS